MKTYVLKTERHFPRGGFIPAGTVVRQSFAPVYGLVGEDEIATGKPHMLVELMENNHLKMLFPAFTIPTEDLIPL